MKTILGTILFIILSFTSCKDPTSKDRIYTYLTTHQIPQNATLFIANGLGCYHCNKKVVSYFHEHFATNKNYFLITCEIEFFQETEQSKIQALENKFTDTTGFLSKLDLGTNSPSILKVISDDSLHIIGLDVYSVDAILATYH